MNKLKWLAAASLAFAPLVASHAATVYWTDWTSAAPGLVSGTVAPPSGALGVTATGTYSFAQTAGGPNFWDYPGSSPYISASVSNDPPASDIIALNTGGTETITFSHAVVDPLVALVSWNGNTVHFSAPIEVLSNGAGHFGSGVPVLSNDGQGFTGFGEVHGVIRLKGTFTSFSFTHTDENWHGFTVGVTSAVPEPDAAWLVLAALPLVAWGRRRT